MTPRSAPGPVTSLPSSRTRPRSGRSRPARSEISVVLPAPEYPTSATNSPRLTWRLTSCNTSVRLPGGPKPLLTFCSSRNATGLAHFETQLHQTHQSVQHEPDDADGEDAEDDVFVNQAVVLLPEEPPDTWIAGEHLRGHD